ncbi:Hypothetical predicted protein [Cloeon dipterum]|uniref:Uncharacterized protein n=1 Tax=Cloeon dipterum TaxID=197152 RepID=A0A8S1C698_9INSE|nr:Hypothetical predicted protein [Cloeon dipterum]
MRTLHSTLHTKLKRNEAQIDLFGGAGCPGGELRAGRTCPFGHWGQAVRYCRIHCDHRVSLNLGPSQDLFQQGNG